MQRMWDGNERCCMNPSRYFGQWSVWLLEPPSSWHVDLKLPEETMGRGKGILHALHVEYERSCSNHACLVLQATADQRTWDEGKGGGGKSLGFLMCTTIREIGVHM